MPAPARSRTATLARAASESRPILAAVLAIVAAFLLVAMGFHSQSDGNMLPGFLERVLSLPANSGDDMTSNPCGSFGATLAVVIFSLFGYSAFLIPVFIGAAAWFALN
ncbi:MAG: DNA translocase FtsK 4TM domain-containing protein, partial [Verrucomicrobiota bacterium]